MQTYLELSHRHFPGAATSAASLEGYLNALVLVEGLDRAGPALTREGFINAVEHIQERRLGGSTAISFAPDDHQGLDAVYFTWIRDGRLRLITDWKEVAEVFAASEPAGLPFSVNASEPADLPVSSNASGGP